MWILIAVETVVYMHPSDLASATMPLIMMTHDISHVMRYPGCPTVPPIFRRSVAVKGAIAPFGPLNPTTAVAVAFPGTAVPLPSVASSSRDVFLSPSVRASHWLHGKSAQAPVVVLVTRTHARCQPRGGCEWGAAAVKR